MGGGRGTTTVEPHHWEVEDDADGTRTWRISVPADDGAVRLEFGALAEGCEVRCDGVLLAGAAPSDFARPVVLLPATGADRLVEVVRIPRGRPGRTPRGRWRTTLTGDQSVRWRRVSMVGRAPFLGDVPVPDGPYRPVVIAPADRPRVVELGVDTRAPVDGSGHLWMRILLDRPVGEVRVSCAGEELTSVVSGERELIVDADVARVEPWWPHVLGAPALYPLRVEVDGHSVVDTRVGFRTLEVDLAADDDGAGVSLAVNGVPLHARGAVWSPVASDDARAAVRRAADGGAVLLRVPGTTLYPPPEFWEACAAAGVLVWQDLMTANVDPPDEPPVTGLVRDELRDMLLDAAGSPSLAVVSGGSEVHQQAEMSGVALEATGVPLLESGVPAELERLRPGTPAVPSTPWTPSGHGPAIRVGAGVAHYFGVGGYRRPVSDVRTADVRFAAEGLAFAVPPMPWRVREMFGTERPAGHDPGWKAAVPRDRNASWDFEDVRDVYVREVYGVDAREVRLIDPELYLELGAGAVARVMDEVLGWWRSERSRCAGGLVLTARDLVAGAGWGMTDVAGVPKSSWYAAYHRWAPCALWLDDRGLDGLWVELHTDCPDLVGPGELGITVRGAEGEVLHSGSAAVEGCGPWSVDEVLGKVVDVGHALRFGPPVVACVDVQFEQGGGDPVRLVWTPPVTSSPPARTGEFDADLRRDDSGWKLILTAGAPVRDVVVDAPGFVPSDSWFALSPGWPVTVRLDPLDPDGDTERAPRPRVTGDAGALAHVRR